jgi:hypothetical protein
VPVRVAFSMTCRCEVAWRPDEACPQTVAPQSTLAVGGLISYGSVTSDRHRQAAGYVDRILKREKPADLPVQAPTKYELAPRTRSTRSRGLHLPGVEFVAVVFAERLRALLTAVEPVRKLRRHSRPEL